MGLVGGVGGLSERLCVCRDCQLSARDGQPAPVPRPGRHLAGGAVAWGAVVRLLRPSALGGQDSKHVTRPDGLSRPGVALPLPNPTALGQGQDRCRPASTWMNLAVRPPSVQPPQLRRAALSSRLPPPACSLVSWRNQVRGRPASGTGRGRAVALRRAGTRQGPSASLSLTLAVNREPSTQGPLAHL